MSFKEKFIEWFKATGIRVLRTMLQVAAGFFTVGLALNEIDWIRMLSVTLVAGIYALLTNAISKPPESQNDGKVIINEESDTIGDLTIMTSRDELMKKKKLVLEVEHIDDGNWPENDPEMK